jgi:tetratricopeptide (TPR) repeat protein
VKAALASLLATLLCVAWTAACRAAPSKAPELHQLDSQFRRAYERGDGTLAARTLLEIAQRWPEAVGRYSSRSINTLVTATLGPSVREDKLRRVLLERLHAMDWKEDSGLEPSRLCLELARLRLQQRDTDKARELLPCIHAPYDIVALRVDRRFVSLLQGTTVPTAEVAAHTAISQRRQIVDREPRNLAARVLLGEALMDTARFREALAELDEAWARISAAKSWSAVYDDPALAQNRLHDRRGQALARLGDMEGAIAALRLAVAQPEIGQLNISNRIRLSEFLVSLERTDRAEEELALLATVQPEDASLAGTRLESVRLAIALAKQDEKSAGRHTAYLRKHRDDDVSRFQLSLLLTNENEAAMFLIDRLENPVRRLDALVSVQRYDEPPSAPPGEIAQRRKWEALVARPDVQKAIAKVGSVQTFPLQSPAW